MSDMQQHAAGRTALLTLIADLESLRDHDHAVERRIHHVVFGDDDLMPPDYTYSIDSALALVPADTPWKVGLSSHGHSASVWDWNAMDWCDAGAPTIANAAIALCIAALKARAAQ